MAVAGAGKHAAGPKQQLLQCSIIIWALGLSELNYLYYRLQQCKSFFQWNEMRARVGLVLAHARVAWGWTMLRFCFFSFTRLTFFTWFTFFLFTRDLCLFFFSFLRVIGHFRVIHGWYDGSLGVNMSHYMTHTRHDSYSLWLIPTMTLIYDDSYLLWLLIYCDSYQ